LLGISKQKAINSLCSLDKLVRLTEWVRVYWAVRIGFKYIWVKFYPKSVDDAFKSKD
jgi:hypothetical protein